MGKGTTRNTLKFFTVLLVLASLLLPPLTLSASAADRKVTGLGVVKDPMGAIVTISGDGPLDFEYFLIEGRSLAVDIKGASNEAWPTVRMIDSPFLGEIKIGEHLQPKMVRVLMEIKAGTPHKVTGDGAQIVVALGRPGERPPPPKPSGPANSLLGMRYVPLADKSRVELDTMKKPEFKVLDSGAPTEIAVLLPDTGRSPTARTGLDLSDLARELLKVETREDARDGRFSVTVIATLSRAVPYRVYAEGGTLFIDVDRIPGAAAAPGARGPAPAAATLAGKVRHGSKVSLDFIDADINDILRLISDVSGVNFAAGEEVRGKVSIRLIGVPWETALETVLLTNNPPLVQVPLAENIIRITTEDTLMHEEEKRQKKIDLERRRLKAEQELEEEIPPPMVTREFAVSYATLGEGEGKLNRGEGSILSILESFKSKWNELFVADPRTNTIIVRDSQEAVEGMARVLRQLDTPTPAVLVEARIVEVADDVTESLGIRWNADFTADQAHGNALPMAFPNSIAVGGEVGGGDGTGNYMVNLPASTPTAAIGLSFGHIASTFSLDMQLSAQEDIGKAKILSNPKILVVQNEKATINIGDKLPIPTTDVEGNRTVQFERTGIKLEVTPQVTNDNRVFMNLLVEKSSRGDTVATTEGLMYSINTRDAVTKVLIGDGETAVIGGILTEESADTRGGVPYFQDIPGLGWLFKNKTVEERRSELLIFLTPRIIHLN